MIHIDLDNLADRLDSYAGVRCPACGCTAVAESIPGKPGERWLNLSCSEMGDADCGWSQTVAIDADANARMVEQPPADRLPLPETSERRQVREARERWSRGKAKQDQDASAPPEPRTTPPPESPPETPSQELTEEPTMPRKKQSETCRVAGCDRDKKITRGMCHEHYQRWVSADRPDLDTFICDQGLLPVGSDDANTDTDESADAVVMTCDTCSRVVEGDDAIHHPVHGTMCPNCHYAQGKADQAKEEAEIARERADQTRHLPDQRIATGSTPAPTADGFKLVDFDTPIRQAWVGVLGSYLTITAADGRLLAQIPVADAD